MRNIDRSFMKKVLPRDDDDDYRISLNAGASWIDVLTLTIPILREH